MDDKLQAAVLVLNLSYLSDRDWYRWAKASGPAADWSLISGDDPTALDQVGATTGTKVVVLHSEPEEAVRMAIRAGAEPLAALAEWQQGARALRNVLRRHRRTCYLIEAGQLLGAEQDALCTALAGWSGQAVAPPVPAGRPKVARDTLGELLALQAIQSMPAIGRLRNELRAGGFAPAPEVEARAQQAVMADAARDLHQSEARQRQAREEKAALRASVNEITHRFEIVTDEYETCVTRLDESRSRQSALENELAQLSTRLDAVTAKHNASVADLAAVRAALKEQRAAGEAAAATHAEDLAAEQRLAGQEQALLKQHVFALQSILEEETGAHGDLKVRYMELADVTLPELRAELARQQRATLQSEAGRQRLKAQLHECQQHRVALAEERRFLALELERRQQDIAALFDSTSWRVTAPMRALRLTLSGRNG